MSLQPEQVTGLIDHLRQDLGAASLEVRAAPQQIAKGGDATVYELELANAPAGTAPHQILRIFKPTKAAHDAELEGFVMNELQQRGFPAPRSLWSCNDRGLFGTPAMLCDQMSGRPLFGAAPGSEDDLPMRLRNAAAELRGVAKLSHSVAELAVALQDIDGEEIYTLGSARGLAVAGLLFEAELERVRTRVGGFDEPELDAAFAWLEANCPPPSGRLTLCHGDLNPTNLLVEGNRVTAVIDWSAVSLGHPAREVGVVRSGMRTIPLLGPLGAWLGRRMADSLTRYYTAERPLDEAAASYFEAWMLLRLALNYRDVQRGLREGRGPWDNERGQRHCARHFEAITGVALPLGDEHPAP